MDNLQRIPESLSAQQIAAHLNKSRQAVWNRAKKENWQTKEVPNPKGGGIIKLYTFSNLPEDIQTPIQNNIATHKNSLAPTTQTKTTLNELPEWAKEIALLRFDLVQALIEAKENAANIGQSKTEAVKNFIDAYNNGLIYAPIREALGKSITRSTILNWEKILKEANMDYRVLAPKWGRHRTGSNKLTDAEIKQFEIELLNDKKVKVDTAIYHTKVILEYQGIESPSGKAAFRAYAKTYQKRRFDLWTLARKGEKALVDEALPYLIRDISKLDVGEILVADGHRCSFTAINPFTGKPARPLLVVFYDWKSGNIAGAYIDFQENVQVIHNALRNAILNLGKIPKFVYLDNGKAFKAKIFTNKELDLKTASVQGVYARLGIKTIFAKPYNARSKVVERFFEEFEASFSRHQSSFVGTCIDDKPAGMNRNEDFTKAINPRKSYALEDVYQAMAVWHEMFHKNRMHPHFKGKTKGEIFEAGRGPGVDEGELHYLMMHAEIKKLYPNGVKMLGAFYWHEALYGLRDKVIAKYDLNDLSKIYVYLASTGEHLCTATRWQEVHPIAQYTGSPKDITELKRKLGIQAGLKKKSKALLIEIRKNYGNAGNFQPLLEESIQATLPEQIEVPGGSEIIPEMDYDLQDVQALSELQETETETKPVEADNQEEQEVFHSSAIDKYEYLTNQERELTGQEIEWIENEFYPTPSGQMIIEAEGRKVFSGNKVEAHS